MPENNQLVNSLFSDDKFAKENITSIIEIYKIYVSSAESTSERRIKSNQINLSIHTGIISGILILYGLGIEYGFVIKSKIIIIIPVFFLVILCVNWLISINSSKKLNIAKFSVIDDIENLLPIKPYVSREWRFYLDNGKKYSHLTNIEGLIPVIIGVLYIILAVFFFL